MEQPQRSWIINFIWGIADDVGLKRRQRECDPVLQGKGDITNQTGRRLLRSLRVASA
jgi:hypothetical protein